MVLWAIDQLFGLSLDPFLMIFGNLNLRKDFWVLHQIFDEDAVVFQ